VAYNAEIQIGVKGVRDLRNAQARIERLSRLIDEANKKPLFNTAVVANLNTYNAVLAKANRTLGKTQIELDSAGNAVGDYKKAITNLVKAQADANEAKRITNNLLDVEAQKLGLATEKLKAYNAAAAPARQVGSMAGAYLRPGEAGLKGQTSDASEALALAKNRLNVERGIGEVQEALSKLDQDSIRAHNARLDLQADYLTVLQRTADAAKFRAQQPAAQLALPEFQERGLQLLDDSVKANQSQLRIETALNGQRQRGVRFLEKQAAEEKRQVDLGLVKTATGEAVERTNRLTGFETLTGQSSPISPVRTAAGARAASGFPVALPEINLDREVAQREKINSLIDDQITFNQKISDGLKRQRAVGLDINNLEKTDTRLIQQQGILKQRELRTEQKIQEAIKKGTALRRGQESALIGGAFPLLFGQGLGASAGGALGGFFGGKAGGQLGFGLSLVGTAIGQAFDDATRRVTEMGNALRTLDLSTLEQSAIRVSEELKFQVEKLKESGNFARARALVEQTVAQQTGSTATVIKDIANSGNLLKAAFDEVVASGSVLLGSVAAPLAAALAGVLKVVAEIFKFINRIIAAVGGLLRTVEDIIDPARNIQKAIESIAPAAAEATAEMKKFADETLRALGLAQQTADLDLKLARVGPSNSAENKIARRQVQLEKDRASIKQRINAQLTKALQLTGKERIEAVASVKLLEAKLNRIADLNAARDIANIKLAEERRLNKENLDIENRRAEAVKRRLQDAQAVLTAVIQANQAEQRVLDFKLPDPTPFSKFSNEEIRDQQIATIQKERDNQLDLLRQRGLKEELRIEKEREIIAKANLAIKQANADFVNKERTEQERAIKATVEANANLDKQIALIQAKLNGTQEEVRLNQELNGIVKSIGSIGLEEIETLQRKLELLRDIRKVEAQFDIQQQTRFAGAGLQAGFIGQAGQAFEKTLIDGGTMEEANKLAQLTQEMVIAQTQAQALESAVLGIGNAFATAMTTGVSELIAGTKSAEEVFADFLKNVGDALINAAAQMIATYIAIGIAKAFAGLSGGTTDMGSKMSNTQYFNPNTGLGVAGPNFGLANGGPAKAGQPYMVGERGPELFVPSTNGGVLRNEDLRSAMSRQQSSAPAMNFSFETTNIGGTEYVSREQLEAAMAVTRKQAASDGAKRGMNMTLDKMQHSPATRRRVGI
tara:strand:+ start:201 stop:3752 length:3552 start_codon:yes stop_codon:yes gene_type:complete